MNLLCPNCQKPLTVPDQYAGQLMKCPLCNGTFSVPGLAPPASPPALDVFPMAPEPPAPPPPPTPRNDAVTPPQPAREKAAEAPVPPSPPPPPAGYEHTSALTLKPEVLVWIAPAALGLIFLLLFFPWVTVYSLGRNEWDSQLGWGTGFGHDWSAWGVFYILSLFCTLALAIGVAVLPLLPVKLPPPVEQVWAWRAPILAAVILLPTMFLLAQLAFGFGLEQAVLTRSDGPAPAHDYLRATLRRSFWLDLVVLLHLVALAGAALDAWLQRRRSGRAHV